MIRAGEIEIDEQAREVHVGRETRHLEPKAFEVLVYLARHADRVVPKSELLDAVWGDQFVSESALTTRVKEIRKALNDNGTAQRVIRNVRGQGYRFISPVTEEETSAPSTPLYGRDTDLAAIEARLNGSDRVVTLIGPGGVGKTSLALEVARRMRPRLRDGARVVRLAQVREPGDVLHAIGLDAAIEADGPIAHAVAAIDGLVVIDNGEHVIEAVAAFADEVAGLGGPVRLLITSRERTGVAAEHVWALSPLDAESARTLLVARATAGSPDLAFRSDDATSIRALLEMVDRLPLGIEMLAPHLATLRPADLLDALNDRPDLLRATNRAADERQRSLGALVDWSLRLLGAEARDVLIDLSVFAGPTSLDRAAEVLDRSASELALGPLKELVGHSLVVADTLRQPTTYRLLETVRAVVAPRRSSAVDRRHAEYCEAEVAAADAAMRSGDDLAGARRIDDLVADLRVAHRWARAEAPELARSLTVSLIQYAQERQWPEPTEWWFDDDAPPAAPTPEIAAVVALEAANRGEYGTAVTHARHATTSTDHRVRASGLDTLANVALYTGDTAGACRNGQELIAIGDETDDGYSRTLGVLAVALGRLYSGDREAGRAALDEHTPLASPSATSRAWMAYGYGEVATQEGDLDEAIRRFEQAIELASDLGNRFVMGVSEVGRLAALARGGELDDALAAYDALLERYRRIRNHTHAVTALRNAVLLLARAGDEATAWRIEASLRQDGTKSTYGTESAELDAALRAARARHGDATVETWLADGSGHGVDWALDQAIDGIRRLASGGE